MLPIDTSRKYEKITESLVTIRFQDCDPLRHLNNAKYFDYYFNARDDQFAKLYHFKTSELYTKYQAIWVVYNHQIAYLRSAMMGEWVKIFSRIVWFNHNTVVVEYFMTDENKRHLKNVMWTTLRFVTWEGRSIDHPEELMDFLNIVTLDDVNYSPEGFQKRIKEVKSEVQSW